jgi:nucleotide-binding universal stress UspA family protein
MNAGFTDIVVPIDASPTSRRGVQLAIELARGGARLHFCSVVSPVAALAGGEMGMPFDPVPLLEAYRSEARAACDAAVAAARAAGVEADADVLTGEIVPEIQAHVTTTRSTALVVGSHARSGAARLFFGSIAEALMQGSRVPVVIGHLDDETLDAGPIAVAVDGSPAALPAIGEAIALARTAGRALVLLNVVDGDAAAWRLSEKLLSDAADVVRDASIDFESMTLQGQPAEAILRAAGSMHCSLVVMGTRGHRGALRLLRGSVAAAVVERARVPVMVVRSA